MRGIGICPLRSGNYPEAALPYPAKERSLPSVSCLKGNCEFWVTTYTVEHEPVGMCAIVAIAMKRSDGHVWLYKG